MRLPRTDLTKQPLSDAFIALERPAIQLDQHLKTIQEIIQTIKKDDDAALIQYTKQWDGVELDSLLVEPDADADVVWEDEDSIFMVKRG